MRGIAVFPAELIGDFRVLGTVFLIFFVTALGLIVFDLAQLRKKPCLRTLYIFLTAVAASAFVGTIPGLSGEGLAEFFLFLLAMLSVATIAEYKIREVHQSHKWTAASTCVITVAYWLGIALGIGSASV